MFIEVYAFWWRLFRYKCSHKERHILQQTYIEIKEYPYHRGGCNLVIAIWNMKIPVNIQNAWAKFDQIKDCTYTVGQKEELLSRYPLLRGGVMWDDISQPILVHSDPLYCTRHRVAWENQGPSVIHLLHGLSMKSKTFTASFMGVVRYTRVYPFLRREKKIWGKRRHRRYEYMGRGN